MNLYFTGDYIFNINRYGFSNIGKQIMKNSSYSVAIAMIELQHK